MGRQKDTLLTKADTVRPYVERAMSDENLRRDVIRAFAIARGLYSELARDRDKPITIASRVATDDEIRDKLRDAIEDLRSAGDRLQGKKERSGSAARRYSSRASRSGSSSTPSPGRRRGGSSRTCSRAAGTTTTTTTTRTARTAASGHRSAFGRSGPAQRRRVEAVGGRDVRDPDQHRPRSRGADRAGNLRRPAGRDREREAREVPPRREVGARVDGPVLAEEEHRDRIHLEVEPDARPARGSGRPHEADHLTGADVRAVRGKLRERREVRVEELVPLRVTKPELVSGGAVPADPVERPLGDRDERLPETAVDVGAALPAPSRGRAPVAVGDGRAAVGRVDVRLGGQLRRRHLRHADQRARRRRQELRPVAHASARSPEPPAARSERLRTSSRAGSRCRPAARREPPTGRRRRRSTCPCSPSSPRPRSGRRRAAR